MPRSAHASRPVALAALLALAACGTDDVHKTDFETRKHGSEQTAADQDRREAQAHDAADRLTEQMERNADKEAAELGPDEGSDTETDDQP